MSGKAPPARKAAPKVTASAKPMVTKRRVGRPRKTETPMTPAPEMPVAEATMTEE